MSRLFYNPSLCQSPDDEQRLATSLTQCQAILRDKQSALNSFHTIAEEQIRTYTTQRRAEMKKCVVDFIKLQLAHERNIQNHFGRLLETMNKK